EGSIRLAVAVEGLEDLALVIVGAHGADVDHIVDESVPAGVVIIAGAAAIRKVDGQKALLHEIPGGIEGRNIQLLKMVIDVPLFNVREYEHDPSALAATPVTVVLGADAELTARGQGALHVVVSGHAAHDRPTLIL